MTKPERKFKAGDHVKVTGWAGSATGKIVDYDWIYHHRLYEWKWGYSVMFDEGQKNPLTFFFIPEGYIQPIDPA